MPGVFLCGACTHPGGSVIADQRPQRRDGDPGRRGGVKTALRMKRLALAGAIVPSELAKESIAEDGERIADGSNERPLMELCFRTPHSDPFTRPQGNMSETPIQAISTPPITTGTSCPRART